MQIRIRSVSQFQRHRHRNNFTDHLYDRLKQEGIFTFRDDERLEQGTEINSGLLRAIDESKIAVVVLSKQYASSRWCLIELAKIVECMDKNKLTVLPVFHYVDPSDVKNQRGSFAEAFAKHENRFKDKIDDVKTWRAALTKVANLSGSHLKDNESESEVIKKIIQRINNVLECEAPFVSDEHLVGMDYRVEQVLDLGLGERLNCVRLVGICGMGGIGKTTLAREIYNRIFRNFEARSFIANVREEFYCYGDLFSTMLRRHLINTQDQFYSLNIPGSEIPKCFSHQNVGFSVNLQGPSDLLGNRLMGIAVCAVFVFRKHDPGYLSCSFNGSPGIEIDFPMKFGKIESYQLLLLYCPSTFRAGFKEILNKVDANGFSQIEVKFKPSVGLGLEVTKCGAHLVFERDIEDLINQTKAGPSFEDSEKDTKIKRSRDDFDGEGAGPSGEATSNDVDEPHPKRIRLPNLIERLIPRLGNWLWNSSTQEQGDSDCEEEKSQ